MPTESRNSIKICIFQKTLLDEDYCCLEKPGKNQRCSRGF